MRYETVIDSLGVRVECNSSYEQREILDKLLEYVRGSNSSYFINYKDHIINPLSGAFNREYFIYGHSKTLASISTMSYQVGKYRHQTVYYIKIIFAGIRQYDEFTDNLSLICMMSICSWLYNLRLFPQLTELDLGIDVESAYENMLVLPVKRVPNVNYYKPHEEQLYDSTVWIEKINPKRKDKVASRSYLYNRANKGQAEKEIVRFELKLQTSFFSKKRTEHFTVMLDAIITALDRYAILHFTNINEQNMIIQQYNAIVESDLQNKSRKLQGLEIDMYRLQPNVSFISNYLQTVLTTHDFHTNMDDDSFVEMVIDTLKNG